MQKLRGKIQKKGRPIFSAALFGLSFLGQLDKP
jgi:hypothetical protein